MLNAELITLADLNFGNYLLDLFEGDQDLVDEVKSLL